MYQSKNFFDNLYYLEERYRFQDIKSASKKHYSKII